MKSKVTVLPDMTTNDIGLQAIDDTNGEVVVEATLTLPQAWALVTQLNQCIQKITKAQKAAGTYVDTVDKPTRHRKPRQRTSGHGNGNRAIAATA